MAQLLIRQKVEDYSRWRDAFDSNEDMRKAGGGGMTHVFRNAEDEDEVVVFLEWDGLDKARRFADSEDLRRAMDKAGVVGKPEVLFLSEV